MKILYLIFNRMKQYILKNKGIFAIFVISSIVSSLVFCFFYGNTAFMRQTNSSEIYNRKYSVTLNRPIDFDNKKLKELCENELVEAVIVENKSSFDDIQALSSVIKGEYKTLATSGRVEFEDGENNAIIMKSTLGYLPGDTYNINGEDFNVIGLQSAGTFITANAFEKLDIKIESLTVVSAKKYMPQDKTFTDMLYSKFNGIKIAEPYQPRFSDVISELFTLCLAFALSITSYMMLFSYMVDSIMNETVVCLIVGATMGKMFLLTALESLLLCSVTSISGILLHAALYKPVFAKLNVLSELTYSFNDYLVIFLLIISITLLVLLFSIKKYSSLSPIQAKRERM